MILKGKGRVGQGLLNICAGEEFFSLNKDKKNLMLEQLWWHLISMHEFTGNEST